MPLMGRGGWVPLLLAGVLAAPLGAQTVLTADDAVKTAVEKNLSLQRSSWDLDAKKRQADNAWGVFLPSTSLGAGLSRGNEATGALGAKAEPSWLYSQSAGLSLSISPSIWASLDTVKLNYRSGQLTYDLARKSLEKNVRLAYASLLLERENLKLAEENIQRKEKNLADTRVKARAGLAPDLDVLSAQVSVETLKPSYQKLQAAFQNDLGQLKVLLGLPLDQPLELVGSLETAVEKTLDLSKLEKGTVSPSERQAALNLEATKLSLESQQASSWLPTATLGWTYSPGVTLKDGAAWADSGSLTLRLSYSLDSFLPWTTSSEKLTQAQESVRNAESLQQETKTNSALTRQNDLRQIQQAVQSLETQALNVALAQRTYDLNLEAYQKGAKDLVSLQNSGGDLNQARYDLLAQRYSLISTVLNLEYELDVPFGTLFGGNQ